MTKSLVFSPGANRGASGVVNRIEAKDAGWQYLNMEMRRLSAKDCWQHDTGEAELALVVLGGRLSVISDKGEWREIGRRKHVFDGMPWALYLPRRTKFTVEAISDTVEIASAWVATDEDHTARLVTPKDCPIELRGGNNASRQINSIIAPGFDCHHLVAVEVYTPGGNWSSYPPHKHDQHKEENGVLKEADLEEIYFYKFRRKDGFAFQRIYTDDRSLDQAVVAKDNDIVLIPEGYHPVSTAYGYDCYYLNFLAGSAQSLAASDDPDHAWTKTTWNQKDARVPVVSMSMEEKVLT